MSFSTQKGSAAPAGRKAWFFSWPVRLAVPNRAPNEDEGFDSFHGNNSSSSDGENDESKTSRKKNETAQKEQEGSVAKDVDSAPCRFVVTEDKAMDRKEQEEAVEEGDSAHVQLLEPDTAHKTVDIQGNPTTN